MGAGVPGQGNVPGFFLSSSAGTHDSLGWAKAVNVTHDVPWTYRDSRHRTATYLSPHIPPVIKVTPHFGMTRATPA